MSCRHVVALGGYVFGALDPAERAELERHLPDCGICRAELVQLAPLPGLLGHLTLQDVEHLDERPTTPPSPSPRRSTRWRVLAVAGSVLLLAAGGLLGHRVLSPSAPTHVPMVWSATDRDTGVHAEVGMASRTWGTEMAVRLTDLPDGQRCMLMVHARDGRVEIAGWWASGYEMKETIPGSTSFAPADIARMEVLTADRRVLVALSGQ